MFLTSLEEVLSYGLSRILLFLANGRVPFWFYRAVKFEISVMGRNYSTTIRRVRVGKRTYYKGFVPGDDAVITAIKLNLVNKGTPDMVAQPHNILESNTPVVVKYLGAYLVLRVVWTESWTGYGRYLCHYHGRNTTAKLEVETFETYDSLRSA